MLDKEHEFVDIISRLITIVSHEFRTPLTIILSSTEILKQYTNQLSDENKNKHLLRIEATVHNMLQILDDILFLEEYEEQRLKFSPEIVEVVEFCIQLLEKFRLSNDNHNIHFNNQQQLILANLDLTILEQILYNLLSNAIKYSLKETNIYLNLFQENSIVIFQIQYEGIGIRVTEKAQFFNFFQGVSNISSLSDIGLGLGLSIVKKGVDLHQGKIMIESGIAIGTKITVMLPLDY
ncbi:HAMP domain-containing histidine kinase [Tolypothrix sp. FACHB-123]|uniref:sensor histidine kinase n=1 Tax=Tolypothrix sp. FACHB-123 TaxID=2692868 RepID=UPI00168A2266|nr:HAMP domain-containing sensor histidine kinase [Tolypothrix sp. FACHB-123]MBD2358732.1 HAMP domain-containing histidine kinase [Tolypothrix sp. FACHB-123]